MQCLFLYGFTADTFNLKPHEVVEHVLVVSIRKLTSLFFGEFFDSMPRCVIRWVFLHPGKKMSYFRRLKVEELVRCPPVVS